MLKVDKFNNLEIIKGDNAIFQLDLLNYAFEEGDIVTFSVKRNKYENDYLINIQSYNNSNNIAKFFISEELSNIDPGHYFYDIELKSFDGMIDTVILAKFRVIGDVTND